jgi:hypothetical protein
MKRPGPTKPKHFTPFFSAAEEIAAAALDAWSNEGGHMHAKSGYIVQTRGGDLPYKVVFDHEDGPDTEQACATMRECQDLIRRKTPTPSLPDTSRDQGPCGNEASTQTSSL